MWEKYARGGMLDWERLGREVGGPRVKGVQDGGKGVQDGGLGCIGRG